ncbi:SDR family oxidoreductase [Salinisphaera sp. USBA-960]|uniref:SDR family NAD(P)-dependent oxidoreductase n=1 Tax=Salinisphaera orenii TaxID=856731 RepID=UPI0013A606E8|nr:SDR family oxidoreductase [Salifodinibacter halophilus]NNC26727.1 SDR family oxidoreductase [Salifodinibacter halophilus]
MSAFAARYGPWALVTGASSGIGAEFARQIASRGVHVVLVARRAERLAALAHEIEGRDGVQTLVVAADLTQDNAVDTVAERIGTRAIGLLVNNAGFGRSERFIEQREHNYDRMLDLHCRAPLLLTHRFASPMAERRHGGIIFTSSTAGLIPTARLAHYSATKSWGHFMAQTLHAELRHDGVDVLSACPGPTDTEFFNDGESHPSKGSRIIRWQMTQPSDVAHAALAGLGRTTVVIPGLSNKLIVALLRLVPAHFIGRLTDRAMRKVMQARHS